MSDDKASRPATNITTGKKKRAQVNGDINRVPLYLLIIASLAGYLYWARETDNCPSINGYGFWVLFHSLLL